MHRICRHPAPHRRPLDGATHGRSGIAARPLHRLRTSLAGRGLHGPSWCHGKRTRRIRCLPASGTALRPRRGSQRLGELHLGFLVAEGEQTTGGRLGLACGLGCFSRGFCRCGGGHADHSPCRGGHAERRRSSGRLGLLADGEPIDHTLHARSVFGKAHGGCQLLLISNPALEPHGARLRLHVDPVTGQRTRFPQLRGHGPRQIIGPCRRQDERCADHGHHECGSQNGHAWLLGSMRLRPAQKLLKALQESVRYAHPTSVPESIRRTIMPKGSFFPRPTKTPTTQEDCAVQARSTDREGDGRAITPHPRPSRQTLEPSPAGIRGAKPASGNR